MKKRLKRLQQPLGICRTPACLIRFQQLSEQRRQERIVFAIEVATRRVKKSRRNTPDRDKPRALDARSLRKPASGFNMPYA